MFACPNTLKGTSPNFPKNFSSPIDKAKKVSRESCSRSRSGEKEECLSLVKASRLLASNLRQNSKDGKKQPKDEKPARLKYSRKLSFERKDYDLAPTSRFIPSQSKLKDRFDKLLGKTSPNDLTKSKTTTNSQDLSLIEKRLPNLSKYISGTLKLPRFYDQEYDNSQNKTMSVCNTPSKKCYNSDQVHSISTLSPKKPSQSSTSCHRDNSCNGGECVDDSDFWGTNVNIMIEDCEEFKSSEFEEELPITNQHPKPLSERLKDNDNKVTSADPIRFSALGLKANLSQRNQGDEKLNLVLDLDETLVNSYTVSNDFNPKQLNKIQQRCAKKFSCRGSTILMIVRPYLFEFLDRVSKYYNLYIYSHGRFEYVSCVLDIIDKEEKYFKRNRVFKNFVEASKNGLKVLENLIPDAYERKRTLIIDDYCHIWKEDGQTICSKKFVPFSNFLTQDKYNKFPLFKGGELKKGETYGWLCHSNKISDLKYYSEGSSESKTSQLEALADFLEGLANTYQNDRQSDSFIYEKPSIESIYKETRRNILKGLKVSILSACPQRQQTFEEIAVLLGAENVKSRESQLLLLDACSDGTTKMKLINSLAENPKARIVSIYWLVECHFLLRKVSINDFFTGSSKS